MTELTFLQRKIQEFSFSADILFNESMAKHTSLRIGGEAEIMAFPKSVDQLRELLKISALLDCKPAILGAGTNVLAPDEGIRGMVICLKDSLSGMRQTGDTTLCIMAGVTMARAAVFAAGLGLSGLEFAHGIPGTVGGGIYMNAGAYGGEIAQVVKKVWVMDLDREIHEYTAEEMDFSYRHSRLETQDGIVLEAEFELLPASEETVRSRMRQLQQKRLASQPLNLPSAGSAFKRPVGGYAAALIDQAGLKGYRVGGAAISEKHAGFAVNLGGATAADLEALLDQVSRKVYDNSGIRLEPEIRVWRPREE